MTKRKETRRERYDNKRVHSKSYPISLACINFKCDGNLGFLLRSAACFGASSVHVIGEVPSRKSLNAASGSLYDYVKIIQHSSPNAFLDYAKNMDARIVAAEICESAEPITSYNFNYSSHNILVVGNEESGIPVEILKNSDTVYIPMPGVGYCLNTSQTANIFLYEAVKRYEYQQEFLSSAWHDDWECYHLP